MSNKALPSITIHPVIRKCLSAAAAALFLSFIAIGTARAEAPMGCYPIPAPVTPNYSQPPNLDHVKQQLLYYRCAQYDADVAGVLAEARQWVEWRAPQAAKPAIVLDIDETSLSNWTRIKRDDFGYIEGGECDLSKPDEACGDIAWQNSGMAPALPPTLDLFNFAKCSKPANLAPCIKVAVFFVTGRYEEARARTQINLSIAGYHDWDSLYLRDPKTRGQPVSVHKIAARVDIERHGYTIIANVGDQESDLVGGHAERKFKIPNPFYFIP